MDIVVDNGGKSEWGLSTKVPVSMEGEQKSWAFAMPGELIIFESTVTV